ncbi:MAG: hypothetical protein O7C39_06750 [Bacteroidetes bacterium]|nr:hypothetical protein [Bacteroidota bacterium]
MNSTLLNVFREDGSLSIGIGDIETGEIKIIRDGACCAQYVSGGHIVYHVGDGSGQVVAVPFDERVGQIAGPPVDIFPPIRFRSIYVSQDGTLLRNEGGSAPNEKLIWLSVDGTEEDLGLAEIDIRGLSLSPDGKIAAVQTPNEQEGFHDIVLVDLETGTRNRLTFNGFSTFPAWSADGLFVYYEGRDRRATGQGIYRKLADLSANEEFVLPEAGDPNLSTDGNWLAYRDGLGESNLSILDLQNDVSLVVDSAATRQDQPAISPDSRYVAFRSQHAGQDEVYVRSLAGTGFWSISSGPGSMPNWSPDGNYIYFIGEQWSMWRVRVTTTPSFQRISSPEIIRGQSGQLRYSVDQTTGRILMGTRGGRLENMESELLNIVLNFPKELARIAPPSR